MEPENHKLFRGGGCARMGLAGWGLELSSRPGCWRSASSGP